jgi:hypothetical protein
MAAPAVMPLASPITATSSRRCAAELHRQAREQSTCVGRSDVVLASTFPLFASHMFSLSRFLAHRHDRRQPLGVVDELVRLDGIWHGCPAREWSSNSDDVVVHARWSSAAGPTADAGRRTRAASTDDRRGCRPSSPAAIASRAANSATPAATRFTVAASQIVALHPHRRKQEETRRERPQRAARGVRRVHRCRPVRRARRPRPVTARTATGNATPISTAGGVITTPASSSQAGDPHHRRIPILCAQRIARSRRTRTVAPGRRTSTRTTATATAHLHRSQQGQHTLCRPRRASTLIRERAADLAADRDADQERQQHHAERVHARPDHQARTGASRPLRTRAKPLTCQPERHRRPHDRRRREARRPPAPSGADLTADPRGRRQRAQPRAPR